MFGEPTSPAQAPSTEGSLERSTEGDGLAPTLHQRPFSSVGTTVLNQLVDEAVRKADPSSGSTLPGPGDVIGGTYRILGELGRGAMGVVFLALDERLERKVAIKLIRQDLLHPGFKERFMQEARAMARVNHPNVLYIHAFGEHAAVPYFVMELVEGKTLEAWLEENAGPTDLDVALQILNEVCHGVSAIHAAGTVHRDIKPSNILLDWGLRSRIADFGVSTLYHTGGTAPNEVVGTPAYMAPEVAFAVGANATASPRADVYSLGCVAYELLTGRLPFEVEGELAWMVHHATMPVPPPSTFRADLPHIFDQVLLKALAKKPEDRTPTVEMFRRSLMEAREESLEPERILVAEDDDDFRELLSIKLRLEFPDADIQCVANGRAALEALEAQPASVAILDLQMPGLDGLALTAQLRAREKSATMPIIVLTASGGPEEWKQLASLGADRFMVKPVNLDDVMTLIRHAVRERSSVLPSTPRASQRPL
ncbi:MAG TPA: protein kinase [Polyangiaceae bacterium]|nr:protein kinase [Polyangiaceae bacterium]